MTSDDYARAIIGEGQRLGITPKGIQIALATALVESNLRMYANAADPASLNFPHDAVGSDHQSVGLFQQQPWWGTIECRMDAACSARQFFLGVGHNKGLTDFDYNSDAHSPGSYAQAVQVSAVPDAYDTRWNDAVALYNRLATPMDANAWPLPPDVYWGPFEGPDNSWSNRNGNEPQSSRDGLTRWQTALGIHPSGVFDNPTKAAAIVCQQSHGWHVTGNVYKGEWDAVIKEGWRLPAGVVLPLSGVLRANLDFCKQGFNARAGDKYDWGGYFDPTNLKRGTDCSGLVDWALKAVLWGPTNMIWQRTVNTESWPPMSPPGTQGPFGTICIGTEPNWPPGAVVKVAILHGGGGAKSHMECEVDGLLMESGGNGGRVNPPAEATPLDDPSWTDFWYLPGPIIENSLPASVIVPAPAMDLQRLTYEQLAGPVGADGYGQGWPQLGTNGSGANLTVVDFLAKYKPVLDALLEQSVAGTLVTPAAPTGNGHAAPPVGGGPAAANPRLAISERLEAGPLLRPDGPVPLGGPPSLPIMFTVEGHASDMFFGPVADTATQLENEGHCHHQPIGYNNGAIPFDNRSGENELARLVGATRMDNGVPFPVGTKWVLGIFSQGAIIGFDFFADYLAPGKPLAWRTPDLLGVLAYGNPCRQTDSIAPWAVDLITKPGTHGLDPYHRFGLPGFPAKPDNWMDVYREGDIFAENGDDEGSQYKAAVYQAVARGDFLSDPFSLAFKICQMFGTPIPEVLGMINAIISGVVFLGDQPNPHYSPYDITGGLNWVRNLLTGGLMVPAAAPAAPVARAKRTRRPKQNQN